MTHTDLVLSLIKAIEENDKDNILDFFAEDAIFHNIPMHAAQGHEEIWKVFAAVHDDAEDIKWDVHDIAESKTGQVLTERTDHYKLSGKWIDFEVMGIFEIEAGKIKHWRDYFDLNQ